MRCNRGNRKLQVYVHYGCLVTTIWLFVCSLQKDHDDLESLERDMNEESGWKLVRAREPVTFGSVLLAMLPCCRATLG